jgi:hypothetical protein
MVTPQRPDPIHFSFFIIPAGPAGYHGENFNIWAFHFLKLRPNNGGKKHVG